MGTHRPQPRYFAQSEGSSAQLGTQHTVITMSRLLLLLLLVLFVGLVFSAKDMTKDTDGDGLYDHVDDMDDDNDGILDVHDADDDGDGIEDVEDPDWFGHDEI